MVTEMGDNVPPFTGLSERQDASILRYTVRVQATSHFWYHHPIAKTESANCCQSKTLIGRFRQKMKWYFKPTENPARPDAWMMWDITHAVVKGH